MIRSSFAVAIGTMFAAGFQLRRRRSARKKPTNDWVPFISRPHATRRRSDGSTVACDTSIRSGTSRPRRYSRMYSRPIRNARSLIGGLR